MAFGQIVKTARTSTASFDTLHSVDLGSLPTSGNLLIFTACNHQFGTYTTTPPAGFILLHEQLAEAFKSVWYYKISDGTEQTADITWSTGGSGVVNLTEYEWDGSTPVVTKNTTGYMSDAGAPISSSTATPTAATNLVVAMHSTDGNSSHFDGQDVTAGWTKDIEFANEANFRSEAKISSKINATGIQECIHTDTDIDSDSYYGAIAVFDSAGAAATPTVTDINTDEIVLDGEANVTFATSDFAGEITSAKLVSGGAETLALNGVANPEYQGSQYGDSYSNGATDLGAGIAAMVGMPVTLRGVAGNNIQAIEAVFTGSVPESGDDIVFIQGGINNIQNAVSDVNSILQTSVQNMVDHAIANNIDYRVINIAPFGAHANWNTDRQGYLETYNAWVAATFPTKYVDMYTVLLDPVTPYYLNSIYDVGDALHPNNAGFREVDKSTALTIQDYFSPVLAAASEMYDFANVGSTVGGIQVDLGGTSYSHDGTGQASNQVRSYVNFTTVIGENYSVRFRTDADGNSTGYIRAGSNGSGTVLANTGAIKSITSKLEFTAITTETNFMLDGATEEYVVELASIKQRPTFVSGIGTFNLPDVAAYTADTVGAPMTSASNAVVATLGDGTDTADLAVTYNPIAGWAVQEAVSAPIGVVGKVGEDFVGAIGDGSQFYYPTADATSISADGTITTDSAVNIDMQFWDTADDTWKQITLVIAVADTVPDAFSFPSLSNQAVSTVLESNIVTVTGINSSTAVTMTTTDGMEYRINGGTYKSTADTVVLNDTVQLRVTSSGSEGTMVTGTLDIGGVTDLWGVTTLSAFIGATNFRPAFITSMRVAFVSAWNYIH